MPRKVAEMVIDGMLEQAATFGWRADAFPIRRATLQGMARELDISRTRLAKS